LVIQSNRDTLLSSGRISSALNIDAWWATLMEGVGDSSKRRGVDKVTTLAVACKKRQPIRIFASTRDQVETPLPLGEAHDKIEFVVCHENSGGFEHFFCTQLVPHVSVGVGLAGVHSGTGGIGMGAAEGVGGASNPPATSVGAPSSPNALDAIIGRAHVTDDDFSVDTNISHIEGNVRKFA